MDTDDLKTLQIKNKILERKLKQCYDVRKSIIKFNKFKEITIVFLATVTVLAIIVKYAVLYAATLVIDYQTLLQQLSILIVSTVLIAIVILSRYLEGVHEIYKTEFQNFYSDFDDTINKRHSNDNL